MYSKFISELTGNTYHVVYGTNEEVKKEVLRKFQIEIDIEDEFGGLLEIKENKKLLFVFNSTKKEDISLTITHEALHAAFCELRHMAGEIEINNTVEETICYMQGMFICKLKSILDKFMGN